MAKSKKVSSKTTVLIFIAATVVALGLAWLIKQRSDSKITIDSFEDCKNAGYPIQESYPEVCITPDGLRFTNPTQSLVP